MAGHGRAGGAQSGHARGFDRDVAVVGGCGRVGLPLAVALASRGLRVTISDLNGAAVAAVRAGRMPFTEPGAGPALRAALRRGLLTATTDPAVAGRAEAVIVAIPEERLADGLARLAPLLRDGQLIVLRSTLAPGTTMRVQKMVADLGIDADVAFCPERITEGAAMSELATLPQIVASHSLRGQQRAAALLGRLSPVLVPMTPEEAELAKLFCNAWRYLTFAAANQFFMIANDRGLDYERIRAGMTAGYPRAAGLPGAGLTAGPCLRKDAGELAAACGSFPLGEAAITVNEGLPGYLVARLGMAFKAGSDDARGSLGYELKRLLEARAAAVLCADPLVRDDPGLLPLGEVLDRAGLLVIAAPHPEYRELRVRAPVVDVWNLLGRGVLV
jgi:UDP-N-acetyl-D-mannosaminuronic acid dehydrogenase